MQVPPLPTERQLAPECGGMPGRISRASQTFSVVVVLVVLVELDVALVELDEELVVLVELVV